MHPTEKRTRLHRLMGLACAMGLVLVVGSLVIGTSAASEDGVLFVTAVATAVRGNTWSTSMVIVAVNCEQGIVRGLAEENFRIEGEYGADVVIDWCDERSPGIYSIAVNPAESTMWPSYTTILGVRVRCSTGSGATVVGVEKHGEW